MVKALREYLRKDEADRTPDLRMIAALTVLAREAIPQADGEPDWRGRTHAYREWISEAYRDAGIYGEDARKIQSAARYHVGVALRDYLDADTLADYGLAQASPVDRARTHRRVRAQTAHALSDAGGPGLKLGAALSILTDLDPAALAALPPEDQATARGALADLERRVAALIGGLSDAG
ncbi:hypothetical protein [Nocardioides ochotonae]|uniref:hypothetical protein n=1 Tax=Nocardioides ochotonae TaxID=2685869 RepID=UPI00174D6325|nr:hypothetical protein [Nocardioides ochotonae]